MRELLINYNHTEDNWHIITQKPTSELPDFDEDLLKKPTKEENMNDMIKITRKQGLCVYNLININLNHCSSLRVLDFSCFSNIAKVSVAKNKNCKAKVNSK